ncbi:MAG: protein kinase [Candidatus Melainabacteria bacterium]|nr:protein kinase [Candidatus Melainabacteria bacterium]
MEGKHICEQENWHKNSTGIKALRAIILMGSLFITTTNPTAKIVAFFGGSGMILTNQYLLCPDNRLQVDCREKKPPGGYKGTVRKSQVLKDKTPTRDPMTPKDEPKKEGVDSWRNEITLSAEDLPGADSGSFPSIGSLIEGKYRLVEGLGEGGMGVVYKVEQVLLNRQMALKTLTGSEFSESSIRRFQAEAKLLAKLDHPGLVKVQDFGFIDNVKPFLVMDFVQGRTLSSVLKSSGVMPLDVAIKIFVELCFALGYAHSKNIVHRDIKPSNIMLTTPGLDSENEHVKVLDFGIAKLLHRGPNETDSLTRTGEIFGSPFYMSPEQCYGKPVDHRSDIYSMGCVMFEVLTGAPPFSGETSIATIMMHQSEKPLTLKEASMGREFPKEIEELVASMLEKEPDRRIQSLLDVAQILIGIQKGLSGGRLLDKLVNAPAQQQKQAESQLKRHNKYLACTIAALFFGLVGMLTLMYFQVQREAPSAIEQASDLPRSRWCKISNDGGFKIFSFPKDYSIGRLAYGPHENIKLDARAEVSVPVNVKLIFVPNGTFLSHPQFLRNFGPTDLDTLDFKETGITDENQHTITPRMPISDDELIYCNHLTGLSGLGLKNCNISDEGLSHVRNLPLKELNIDGTNVNGRDLKGMRCLKSIVYLRACFLKHGGEVLRSLAGSTQIREMHLTESKLKDEDLKWLRTMPNLRALNIGFNTQITDKGLEHIAPLKNLQSICIDETSVTPEAALKCFERMNLTQKPGLKKFFPKATPKQNLEIPFHAP